MGTSPHSYGKRRLNQLELVGFDSCRTDLIIIKTTPPVQLKDVVLGLKYLHSQLVIHGDLKGVRLSNLILSFARTRCNSRSQLNILINKDRRACLADFGLTRVIAEFTSSGPDKASGTLVWMSPEVLWPEKFGYKDARPTKASDVYSLGMVIYEVRIVFAVLLPYLR